MFLWDAAVGSRWLFRHRDVGSVCRNTSSFLRASLLPALQDPEGILLRAWLALVRAQLRTSLCSKVKMLGPRGVAVYWTSDLEEVPGMENKVFASPY